MDAERREPIERLLGELLTASAADRRMLVRARAATLGVTERTVYRWLKELGHGEGRARRRDYRSSVLPRETLEHAAKVLALGRNKYGQANVPTIEAHDILTQRGEMPNVSVAQLRRRLRQEGLSLSHMRAPQASVARKSRHPNHVWEIDVSVAITWYFVDAAGKKLEPYMDAGARFNANKIANYRESKKFIHRYVALDHTTGAYFVWYYYSAGESADDMVDFLFRAMSAKSDPSTFPFGGIPRRIVMDQGPANKSASVRNVLQELGVILELHAPGNAKASGAVEKMHDIWQRRFEGRLNYRGGASDLEELNGWAENFAAHLQTERTHTRHGRPPLVAWMDITPEQLVIAPDRKTFFQLASRAPRSGVLDNFLYLKASGRKWQVEGENVAPQQRVLYRLNSFLENGIRVWDLEGNELAVTEITTDVWGFAENGRMHEWDSEEHKGSTATRAPGQKLAEAVADDPAPHRVPDLFDDLASRVARQRYAARPGTPWTPPAESPLVAAARMSSHQARVEAANRLGRDLSEEEGEAWKARVGDEFTEADFEEAFAEIHLGAGAASTVRRA